MSGQTRRGFLSSVGAAMALGAFPSPISAHAAATAIGTDAASTAINTNPALPFDFGIASYTFRSFTFERVIEMAVRLGVQKLTLKDMHLPLRSSETEIRSALEKISLAGLTLASTGVIYMKSEEEIRNAFAYAKMAGIKFMVGVPDHSLLPVAERYVKETGISLAIHNHGPNDERFPSPESAYRSVAGMDKRMGLCIDIGHTQRLGLDPAAEFERFFDRVFDIHIKDVSASDAKGGTVEIGRGVIDIPKFLATVRRLAYRGTLHFEFEKDEKDPLPGLAESIGYVRGVLAGK